jgi:hypothetical protein
MYTSSMCHWLTGFSVYKCLTLVGIVGNRIVVLRKGYAFIPTYPFAYYTSMDILALLS